MQIYKKNPKSLRYQKRLSIFLPEEQKQEIVDIIKTLEPDVPVSIGAYKLIKVAQQAIIDELLK